MRKSIYIPLVESIDSVLIMHAMVRHHNLAVKDGERIGFHLITDSFNLVILKRKINLI